MVEISAIRPEDREEWLALWDAYIAFYESSVDAATTQATFSRLTAPERENAMDGSIVGAGAGVAGDAGAGADVAGDAGATAGMSARLRGAIARGADGRAVGIVHWLTHLATWTTSDYCYLEDLYVAPGARGTGTGRALIEHVRAWAADHGSTKVYWMTAETNETARRLYDQVAERTGFIHYEIPL